MCNTQLTRWCNDPGQELGYRGYLRLRYRQVDLVIIGLFQRGTTSSPNLIHHCSQRKWQLMTTSKTSGNNYSSSTGNKVHSIKLEFCCGNYAVDGFDDWNALQKFPSDLHRIPCHRAPDIWPQQTQNTRALDRAGWCVLMLQCECAGAWTVAIFEHAPMHVSLVPSNLMVNQHLPW